MTHPTQLSTNLPTFAAENPGDWSHLIEFATAADQAGIDFVDHNRPRFDLSLRNCANHRLIFAA